MVLPSLNVSVGEEVICPSCQQTNVNRTEYDEAKLAA